MTWRLERGANLGPEGTVTFSVWAPRADRLAVRLLDGDGKTRAELPMQPGERGVFTARTDMGQAPVGSDYVYVLPQAGPRPDPVSRRQAAGVHGPSRIVDPTSFSWSDQGWKGLPLEDLLFYELHVGTFTAPGTFAALEERLSYLKDLGVTAVELMPVNAFPGDRNWGYDGALLFAPHDAYGGPEGLRHLVDACHARGLALFLDVVYNHLGPEGNYLADFGPYFTDHYRTPWGSALNFDGRQSDQVRRFFIDNALHWLTEYHVDGLRLDAIHGIYDFGARHLLQELADAFHAEAARLGRRAWLVAESDLNDPRVIRPADAGGHGLDAQWSDDFHHAVHTLVSGNRRGYFVDFGRASDVARAVTAGFVYDGRYSEHRQRHHGASSAGEAATRFVIFNQNHDQIANACQGRRLAQLVGPERQKLATVVLFSTPGLPMLFEGEEFAADEPWDYFTSHTDPGLAEAVREGRHQEYLHLQEEGASVASWADPQDPQTFARVKLRWSQLDEPAHADMLSFYRALIALRNRLPPLRNGRRDLTRATSDDAARVVTIRRDDPSGAAIFTVANFGEGPAWVQMPEDARWQLVLATQMVGAPSDVLAPGAHIAVPGSTAYIFQHE
jgi:maltooligosyltrehalose trehalohydrolase